ncbi:iron-containing alcohol dehydrogenase [uncultured Lactobacillus sp.]|uniref:iron-containing alcohol dehydrogenase n=1 Tax=uncultured Lactobacillus sp. TaxID=153152 RepID=UPI0025D8D757|nr:iron-containing alcohol dehydrogenase [uncultured Lactobacillus sp.]
MQNFNYHNPVAIYFGKGKEKMIGELANHYSKNKKVLVLYSGDYYEKLGISEVVKRSFAKYNITFEENGDIVPNPRIELIDKLVREVKEIGIDFILAVGGGSVIDTAKAVSAGALYDGKTWDFFTGKAEPKAALPVGIISTAASSGSEMSNDSIVNDENHKLTLENNIILPKFAIMNPEYTLKFPLYQTGAGLSDMMTHLLERYFTTVKDVNLTDRLIEGAIEGLMVTASKLQKNPEDYQVRAEIMWAAIVAHNSFLECGREPDWASHRIENELSAEYGITHGEGMAIVFPAWMKYTSQSLPKKFLQLGSRLFNLDQYEYDDEEIIDIVIKKFKEYFSNVGMHQNLREVGIKDTSKFKQMALNATQNDTTPVGHFKKLSSDDIVKIYEFAF